MNRQPFTMNPATPHPDSEDDSTPTLDEAVALAYALLMHKKEGPDMQHARRRAAFDLIDAYTTHKERTEPNLLELCRRSLRALDEDSFPQLRDDLREAINKAEEATQ